MSDKATALSYTSAAATGIGGFLSLSDLALLIGIVATIFTAAVTWYFKLREDRRRQILFERAVAQHQAEQPSDAGDV